VGVLTMGYLLKDVMYDLGYDVSLYITKPTRYVAMGEPSYVVTHTKFYNIYRYKSLVEDDVDKMKFRFLWDLRQHMFNLFWEVEI
jgi:hypothetical protein